VFAAALGRIRTRPLWGAVAVGSCTLMVLSGCGASPKLGGPNPTGSSASTTTHPTIPSVTTSSTVAAAANAPLCNNGQVTVSGTSTGAGLGHVDQVILFTNISHVACTLTGYPGVAGLSSSGQQETQAKRTLSGYLGGLWNGATTPPRVSLTPGQAASAIVEGTDVTVGTETSCPVYDSFLVTPPNLTHSVRLVVSGGFPGCSPIEVHPVVPGTNGISS